MVRFHEFGRTFPKWSLASRATWLTTMWYSMPLTIRRPLTDESFSIGVFMSVSKNPKKIKRSWTYVLVSFFIVIPLFVLTIATLIWLGREYAGQRHVKARIASLRKQGFPMDDSSLSAMYLASTDATKTHPWLELFQQMATPEFIESSRGVPYLSVDQKVPISPMTEWNEEKTTLDFLEKWKTLHSEIIALSVDEKPVQFPIVFDSITTLLPHNQQLRQCANFLVLSGNVALRQRNSAAVHDAIAGLIGLSHVNGNDPFAVSHLGSVSIDYKVTSLLKDAIECDAIREPDLSNLLPKVLANVDIGKEWQVAAEGERAVFLPIFFDAKRYKTFQSGHVQATARDTLHFIDCTQRYIDAPRENLLAFQSQINDVDREIANLANGNWIEQLDSILTREATMAYWSLGNAMVNRAVRHRMAAVSIGIRLFEDRHSHWPNALSELSEVGIDLKKMGPTDTIAFGYQNQITSAKLWGGTYGDMFKIPDVPPDFSDGESPDQPKANAEWLWNFDRKQEQ